MNEKERFELLKSELFMCGYDAIEMFLGYGIDSGEDPDVTENRMDEAYVQMPEKELEMFYHNFGIE